MHHCILQNCYLVVVLYTDLQGRSQNKMPPGSAECLSIFYWAQQSEKLLGTTGLAETVGVGPDATTQLHSCLSDNTTPLVSNSFHRMFENSFHSRWL
jgi:hypothetical protein